MEGVAAVTPAGIENSLLAARGVTRPRRLLAVADVVAAVVSFGAHAGLLYLRSVAGDEALVANLLMSGGVFLITFILALARGQYSARRRLSRLSDVMALAWTLVAATAIMTLIAYLTRGFFTGYTTPSRLALVSSLVIFFALGVVSRWVLSAYQRSLFLKGESVRSVLLIGGGKAADGFLQFLEARPWLGVNCVGRVAYRGAMVCAGDTTYEGGTKAHGADFEITSGLEGLETLHRALVERGAGEVVVALDQTECASLPEITKMLCVGHVPFRVVPSLFEQTYRPASLLGYAELPVIEMDVDPLDRVQRLLKRVMDVTVAGAILVVGACPALLIAAAIKLDSRGPILYRQERVGKNGQRFGMLKFRSMVQDADRQLAELIERDETGSSGQMFKMRQDPRITRVGAFLRKWSLDETPQFVNVLRGEMSLVGPRPPLPHEVDEYEEQHLYRLRALPGITGLWQVSGRSDLSFDQMVKLDRYYMENWSVGTDLTLLLKTVYVVLRRKGAY